VRGRVCMRRDERGVSLVVHQRFELCHQLLLRLDRDVRRAEPQRECLQPDD
jgi:hypothetical protein